MTASTLSLLIVARNESGRIADCIASGLWADEIIVLLDRSEDDTGAIAERLGAKIVAGSWRNEGERRTAGIGACSCDWILELDADERLSPVLQAEIRQGLSSDGSSDGADYFVIPFRNYVGGRWVVHGWGAYNGVAAKACLFRRGHKQWLGGTVHPEIRLNGRRGELLGAIEHYVDEDIAAMYDRLNRYSSAAAIDAIARGEQPRPLSTFRRFFSRFIKSYWQRRGYREGRYGVALALFSALYPVLTHVKILERRDKSGTDSQSAD